jgi:hypothetical protein
MTDPQKDEHIEELLSKLQGIFGKLSHSEEEPSAEPEIRVPVPAPKEFEKSETAPPPPTPPASPPAAQEPPPPLNLYAPPPSPSPPAAAMPSPSAAYETTVPLEDPEKMIVPSAVYFPPGRETEAKSLAQKLETMAPKFTKVAFRLRIGVFLPYDPKSDWKEAVLARAAEAKFQTVFVVIDRPLDDGRRKTIAADLEGRNIYFQEVLTPSIEKKAFYTDVLLGLVFFFDSRKPSADSKEQTP